MKLNYLLVVLVVVIGVSCNGNSDKKETSGSDDPKKSHEEDTSSMNSDGLKIAYVNADSVSLQYKRIIDANREGEEMLKNIEASLKAEENRIRAKIKKLQENFDFMTSRQQAQAQQEVQQMEMNYQKKQMEAEQQVKDFQSRMTIGNYKFLDEFLLEYAAEKGYDFIFSKSMGNSLLYGRKVYDITNEVIEGLNKNYDKSFGDDDMSDTEDK